MTASAVLAFNSAAAAATHKGPILFTNELPSYTNALSVLQALDAGQEKGEDQIKKLIGSRVLFQGNNWDRPKGTNADLNLGKGVLLRVALTPARKVRDRHGGPIWRAEVVGVLKDVSWKERIIYIAARSEDWEAYFVR